MTSELDVMGVALRVATAIEVTGGRYFVCRTDNGAMSSEFSSGSGGASMSRTWTSGRRAWE